MPGRAGLQALQPVAACGRGGCVNTQFPSWREPRLLGRKVLHFYQLFQDSHKHIFWFSINELPQCRAAHAKYMNTECRKAAEKQIWLPFSCSDRHNFFTRL